MRVNVYAEEMTPRVEIVEKKVGAQVFTGLRFYLELPAQQGQMQVRGPFMHGPGDDDSAAVTFWGTARLPLRNALVNGLLLLDAHYDKQAADKEVATASDESRLHHDPDGYMYGARGLALLDAHCEKKAADTKEATLL